jgi:serine/threonine protein kinase/Flp pilus assembly protein TadD
VADLAGKTLGKYRLIEQLGRGGFASVYKAYQPRLDRYVAVKVLHPHLIEGEDFLARFEREAKAVAGLRHPNIIIVHDFDVDDNTYFMVMEFINGQSLKERMEDLTTVGEYMPLGEVQNIIDHVSSALDYAHARDMLHRDIKPSNVILDKSGVSFLADFGIARILSNTQFTATGALIGTPAYMSPEQGQGLSVSPASDVYSLGVLLYELLVGRVPFDADTPLAIIFKHISDSLPSVRAFRPELPEALERVTYKALAKDAEDRYQKPSELAEALRNALAIVQQEVETVAEAPEHPESPPAMTAVEKKEPESEIVETIAVEQDVEEIVEQELEEEFDADEIERMKAPTLAVERDVDSDFDEVVPAVDESIPTLEDELEPQIELDETVVEGAVKPEVAGLAPKKKRSSKLLKVGGFAILGIILVGVVGAILFNAFSPRDDGQGPSISLFEEATPTKRPTNTPRPKPTENAGLKFYERGSALLYEEGDYGGAIDQFNKAIRSGYKDPDVYYERGWACHEWAYYEGECSFEKAIQDYTEAIKIDPNRAHFYSDRAWSLIHIGDLDAALRDYTKATELEPDNPHMWNGKADVLTRIGDYDAALDAVNRALQLFPSEAGFYAQRAWIYSDMGDPEAAIRELERAIELDPENPDYWHDRGWRKSDLEDFQGAIEDFSRAIELQPDNFWHYSARAHNHVFSGNNRAAIQDLDRMLEIDPNNDQINMERGHVFIWMEQPAPAFDSFTRAVELNPENWEAYIKMGEIQCYDFNNPNDAMSNFARAIELAPRDMDWPYMARGGCFGHMGNWQDAIEDFTKAIHISSDWPDPYGQRGDAYRELGMKAEARADYEIFLELSADMPWYDDWRADIERWLRNNP